MVAAVVALVAAMAVVAIEPDSTTTLVHTANAKQTHAIRACERNRMVASIYVTASAGSRRCARPNSDITIDV
jgi:curli biogenesis system outer membrane secretion channel CsgG